MHQQAGIGGRIGGVEHDRAGGNDRFQLFEHRQRGVAGSGVDHHVGSVDRNLVGSHSIYMVFPLEK